MLRAALRTVSAAPVARILDPVVFLAECLCSGRTIVSRRGALDDFLVHEQDVAGSATHALVIGVGSYPHLVGGGRRLTTDNEGMRQLRSPPVSARAFARWLFTMRYLPKPLASLALLVSEEPQQSFLNPWTRIEHPVAAATFEHVRDAIKAWKVRGSRGVSTRKSCERARRNPARRSLAATPVAVLLVRGFAVRRWLGPGAEVLGAGVPGQEPGECLAGQGLSAVAAAFVEVGGQVGNGV